MNKTDPIIRTKLRLPFTRPGLVSRPQLQEQIAQGLHGPLTLVTAPAGFGKTTLVASSVAGCGMPVAWISLDKNDNQAGRFTTYLIAALQAVDKQIGSEAAQLMAEMQQPPPEAVLTSLVNDLDAAARQVVLVLDDYQFISSQAVHDEVAFLLEHCPSTFHLLIATRSDPSLPLARLRARGQMVELRSADLRFTPSEATRFLNDVMGLDLDTGSVTVLEDRTEGWIAGLQMAALSMRDHSHVRRFIEGFSGTNRHILDYMMEEILAGQSPEVQRFLLYTSILERLTASLCDAVTEVREWRVENDGDYPLPSLESRSVLAYLERSNLFLVSLDDERCWFRYHHLFADLLRARLQQSEPNLIPLLHLRASAWLEQDGSIPEAIQHLFAAHEDSRAADLIERYGPEHWVEGDPLVMQLADNLPHETLVDRPKIGLYQAWFVISQGFVEKAIPLLKDLAGHLANPETVSGPRWMKSMVALALAFLSPSYPLPDYQDFDEIPAGDPILRDAADVLFGMALGRRGETGRAAEVSLRCIQREKARRETMALPSMVPFLAVIYLEQGRLHSVVSLYHEFIDPIKQKNIRFISNASNMEIVLGDVLYEWNRLDEAEQHIRDGLRDNGLWQNIMTDSFGLLALIHVLRAKGDFTGAMQSVEKFETRLQPETRPTEFQEEFRTLRVQVQLASGDLQGASQWADQVILSEDFHHHADYYRLTLARICLAQGRVKDAEKVLTGIVHPVGIVNLITRQLEANLLLAASFAGQQRFPEASELVESCLALAEPEGYVRTFLNLGEPGRDLLAAYLRSAAPGHKPYAEKLLEAFSPSCKVSPSSPQPTRLVEPLSDREREVLTLMATGETNQQIARQLFVSTGTIKAHSASIYRKLDVANRTEAVARARQLGILP